MNARPTDHTPSMVDHALAYARRGFPVFPCDPMDKQPLVPRDKDADGKPIPKTGGLNKATRDEAQIREWWRKYPRAMIGLRMGPEAGVFAIDPDVPKEPGDPDGLAAWRDLAAAHDYVPTTHAHVSPRGGRHLLFAYPADITITNSPGSLPPGIDVRGAGGYVIAPPSRMADGREYRLERPELAFRHEPAPDWLLDLLRKPEPASAPPPEQKKTSEKSAPPPPNGARSRIFMDDVPDSYIARAVEEECAAVATAPRGQRNKALNTAAFKLGTLVGAGRLDAGTATRRLYDAAAASGLVQDDGQHAALATIESGLTSGSAKPREFPERKARSGAPVQGREERQQGTEGNGTSTPGAGDGDQAERPAIQVVNGEVPRAVVETEEAIIAAHMPIFTRSGSLVRPVIESVPASKGRQTTVARLKTMCAASLADHTAQVARYQRFDGRSKDWVTINPPAEVMNALLARDGKWRLPPIAGVITTPTLRPDGTILDRPGYDPETRLFLSLDPGFQMPEILERPGREEAEQALHLLEDLLVSFPFVSDVDRAVGLSALMTPVVRGALPTAPLHAIRASTPGTGKSYLVDLASVIATGRRCPVIAAGRTEEETEKRLGALLREGVPIISIDNVNGDLGGDALCQMTNMPIVRVRVLGKSEAPETECRATVFATGNGLILVGDMTRRTVLCTLDTQAERPELRDFDFDPIERVQADRGRYVAAVLTIIRAYRAAGSPKVCGPIGSYEDWTEAVRAPLIWLGQPDPCASMEKAREEDPELSAIRELFGHWQESLTLSDGYTTNTVIKTACARAPTGSIDFNQVGFILPEFRDLLLRQAGDGGAVNTRRLGKWLAKISGRVVDGYRIEMKIDGKHGNRFSLRQVGGSEPADPFAGLDTDDVRRAEPLF
ncbi:bifunctional DNA primase/polymerase [Methylobacterium sp. J-030]|uniref:bifunctional DNA primase/polymerase n=1 Tax=Methylobacterium sp. J-030 TaxID=2836627 RepID=UPI001FBBCD58|nr:bifunctional DNA primase/polymerase [Methylobacterium sp. J-030]MCJ2071411.1 bifunctional DNA primase/polymerase [Methylobacterium sp. J-030]